MVFNYVNYALSKVKVYLKIYITIFALIKQEKETYYRYDRLLMDFAGNVL